MKSSPNSKLKKLSLGKPIKLSSVKPISPKKARPGSVFLRLSVMLLAGISPAFVFYVSRAVGHAPEIINTPLPVKAVGTPVSQLPPTRTPTPSPSRLMSDHFQIPVAYPDDWAIQQDFASTYNSQGGGWHTGEDWVLDPELRDRWGQRIWSAGQPVQSTAAGWVRYASMTGYPCGVVVLEHNVSETEQVYSVYAHIDGLIVKDGEQVAEGQVLGQICGWPGDISNSHLHFEIRSFYIQDPVNGDNPACPLRHKNFPPGPGYWPICGSYRDEKPADEGWLDPSDFILAHSPAAQADSAGVSDVSASTSLTPPAPK